MDKDNDLCTHCEERPIEHEEYCAECHEAVGYRQEELKREM